MEKSNQASVLIVDDNAQNLQVLAKILQENNYGIEFATNGKAALEWVNKRDFDLILLDINMPGMNGFEVCSVIRSKPLLDRVPVIFLSADTERESILKGFELGGQDYITKPFDSRELLVRVRTHLNLKASLENLESLNRSLEEKVAERTSQLKDSNDKLESINIKLLELDKAKTDFLSLISHEIRTPLNGILGPVELLRDQTYGNDIQDLVEILDISVKRLERFSVNALLITRLKTRQFDVSMESILLRSMVLEVLIEHKSKLDAANVHVRFKDEQTEPVIFGEADMLKMCIANLLDNAIKYSPQNSTIEINTSTADHNIILEVKDQGKGFLPETIENVFELFHTDKEYHDDSIGISLPVSKMIADAHCGNLKVGNNPDGGAYARLYLPARSKGI